MPQENLRVKLATLKQGSELVVNGYTIKKKGTIWIVKKGDFYNRSFNENQLNKLTEKLASETIQENLQPVKGRAIRKANKLALALEQKVIKEAEASQRLVDREIRRQERANRPFRRNRLVLEAFDLIIQAVAYFAWFAYFFTDLVEEYLGDKSLIAVVGVLVLSLIVHISYVRQLGKRHRILNAISGFINLILAVAALSFYFGQLSYEALEVSQVLPSLEIAFVQIESISLIAFLFIKWVLTLIINKK